MKNFSRPTRMFVLFTKSFVLTAIATISLISLLAACAGRSVSGAGAPASAVPWNPHANKTMRAFGSDEELKAYLRQLAEERRKAWGRARSGSPSMSTQNQATVADAAPAKAAEGQASKDESITNTQHSGVDEGDIVKLHGDHLVVLRRGRLFTVAIGNGSLKPNAAVDA